ncbi:MAG: trimethylamine methyltransferase family protein, partial [Candidatus Bathyarchaeia archaeon]
LKIKKEGKIKLIQRGVKGLWKILSNEEARSMHVAALEILEKTGMFSESEKIIKVFKDAGAEIEDRKIKIPQYLVEEALKKAPKTVILYGRNPKNSILLEDGRIYFGLGGTPTPYIRDVETGEFRRPGKKDVEECTKLGDALPNLKFIMTIAGAFDVPWEVEYIHEFEALFNNTSKPIVFATPGEDAAKRVLEMASVIVGGMEELSKKPILGVYCETASPLQFTTPNENIIVLAKAKVPIVLGPMPMTGSTAPVTVAGCALIGTCENLAAITLAQLVNPGAPVIYAGWGTAMDPITSRCAYGAPEFALGTDAINASMAHYYGLPCYGFGGCSDSKAPDAQAGAEVMMNSLIAGLSGVNLIHDCGYLAGGSVGSMEMAVICNEIAGMVYRIVKGVSVDDESLAVDVIHEVGPGGHFLSHKHTLTHVKDEIYIPWLFDRTSEVTWVKAGKKDISVIAKERVKKILKEHQPDPLPKDVKEKLSEIVKKAERELVKLR